MALSFGSKVGPYEIVSPLGAGGMGEVYRATDAKLGRDVALKVLPAEMAGDHERLARFQREARALAQLDHPNIVTIYSVEESEGVHFLTMQLVEGQPLDHLIGQSGLPVEQIVEIAEALADALAAAHEKGIVHNGSAQQGCQFRFADRRRSFRTAQECFPRGRGGDPDFRRPGLRSVPLAFTQFQHHDQFSCGAPFYEWGW